MPEVTTLIKSEKIGLTLPIHVGPKGNKMREHVILYVKCKWTQGVNVKVRVQGRACGNVTRFVLLRIQNWQVTTNRKTKTRVPKRQEVS